MGFFCLQELRDIFKKDNLTKPSIFTLHPGSAADISVRLSLIFRTADTYTNKSNALVWG